MEDTFGYLMKGCKDVVDWWNGVVERSIPWEIAACFLRSFMTTSVGASSDLSPRLTSSSSPGCPVSLHPKCTCIRRIAKEYHDVLECGVSCGKKL